MSQTQNTIIIHDGATDELMSILFAASMSNISIKGIMVLNADCQGDPTAKVSSKLLDLISLKDIPVTVSGARGLESISMDISPIFTHGESFSHCESI